MVPSGTFCTSEPSATTQVFSNHIAGDGDQHVIPANGESETSSAMQPIRNVTDIPPPENRDRCGRYSSRLFKA